MKTNGSKRQLLLFLYINANLLNAKVVSDRQNWKRSQIFNRAQKILDILSETFCFCLLEVFVFVIAYVLLFLIKAVSYLAKHFQEANAFLVIIYQVVCKKHLFLVIDFSSEQLSNCGIL